MSKKLLMNNASNQQGTIIPVTLEISRGFYNGGNGIKASHQYIFGYIATIDPNKKYDLYCKNWNSTNYPETPCTLHISFWDENYTYIEGKGNARLLSKYSPPSNAKYIRIGHDVRKCNSSADLVLIEY